MSASTDLFIIGGGINGTGIARDAAGRGLSVRLAEQGDLAGATSSASTKLFHGGLRYLEFMELRLVREALADAGVVASAPTVEDADTGTCVVLVDSEAERTFITTQGAERVITAASLATAAPAPGDVVCVSGYTLLDPTRQPLLDFLAALPEGVGVCVDPGAVFAGLAERDRRAVVAATTLWTSNLAEARALTGEHHPSMGEAAGAVTAAKASRS